MRKSSLRNNWTAVEQYCESHGLAYRVDRRREVLIDTFTGNIAASTPKQAVTMLKGI